jgi:hypothetical protein
MWRIIRPVGNPTPKLIRMHTFVVHVVVHLSADDFPNPKQSRFRINRLTLKDQLFVHNLSNHKIAIFSMCTWIGWEFKYAAASDLKL